MIEFFDDSGVIGRVTAQNGELVALDPAVESYVNNWIVLRHPIEEFEQFYDGWANGYAQARRVKEDDEE